MNAIIFASAYAVVAMVIRNEAHLLSIMLRHYFNSKPQENDTNIFMVISIDIFIIAINPLCAVPSWSYLVFDI